MYLQSENVWKELFLNETIVAENFASEARTSVDGVGEGWLYHPASEFIIRTLECRVYQAYKILNNGKVKDIAKAALNLGKLVMLAKVIRRKKITESKKEVIEFLMRCERKSELCRQKYVRGSPDDEAMPEFLLSTAEECGFSSETFFQVIKIIHIYKFIMKQYQKKTWLGNITK